MSNFETDNQDKDNLVGTVMDKAVNVEQERLRFKDKLIDIREFLSGLDELVFGTADNGEISWAIRDEVIDSITQTLKGES